MPGRIRTEDPVPAQSPSVWAHLLHDLLLRDTRLLSTVAAALWGMVGQPVTTETLWWTRRALGQTGPMALLELLQRGEVLDGEPPRLMPNRLARLLATWAEAGCGGSGQADDDGRLVYSPQNVFVVWTMPAEYGASEQANQSLAGMVRHLIQRASTEIILCAPYLDSWAITWLLDDLRGAASRGVTLAILSHDLGDYSAPGAQAIALLKRELAGMPGKLRCYDAAMRAPPRPLLHAKLVVADRCVALLSSANVTRGGLMHNVEVGVLLTGPAAVDVIEGLLTWIKSADDRS